MKKLAFTLRCILTYIFISNCIFQSSAQTPGPVTNPLQVVNQQLRDLFTPLSRPAPQQEYLFDMTGHVTEDKFWTNVSFDTSNTDNWYRLYWEQYYMAYDTTTLLKDEDIYESVLQYRGDTVQLGVLDVSYYQLVNNALTSKDYFQFDTVNDIISDLTNRPIEPYDVKNIFTFSPLYNKSKTGKVTWVISPSYIFKDLTNLPFYNPSNYQFYIDFGDGNGWVQIDPTIVTYQTIDYSAIGIQGDIVLDAKIEQDGQPKKYSKSKFSLGKTSTESRPYDEKVMYEDMPVYNYRSCNTDPTNRKIVIYLEGLDLLDFYPKENRTAEDIYYSMIQKPNISQLGNFGYDFYIVDWVNSRIDMRSNAMSVVRLLDALKAEVQNDFEFIIIGESMGGVIARYALSYMESQLYLDPNSWPNANRRERMHNCRLMITWDSPHKGASIPLAIQQFYNISANVIGGVIFGMPIATRLIARNFNLFLDGMAAKQLLIYHIDTKSGWGLYKNYSEHPERTSFLNDLAALGNYPQFCKKMAVSNGALNGEMQTKFNSFTDRAANDRLFDFETELYARILWFVKVPILGADLDLRTNPNGQGQIVQFNAGTWGIRIKFYWFGARLITGYNTLFNISEYADAQPYCVNSGGYMDDKLDGVVGQSSNAGVDWNLSRYWLLNLASFRSGSDGAGCWNSQAHVGFEGFASANYNLSICSDGMHFGFIPLQSALDYGTLGSPSLNFDFETDIDNNLANIDNNTPFDIIVANGSGDTFGDLGLGFHNLNQSHLYVKYRNRDCFLSTQFDYRSCNNASVCDGIFGHWVNREIGDEILFLDNLDCSRNSTYEAVFELFVNTFNNPWYRYTNGMAGAPRPGFYSKSNPFIIRDNVNADFRYDFPSHNPPFTINYIFNPSPFQGSSPYNGTWTQNNSAPIVCTNCFDFGKKEDEPLKKIYSEKVKEKSAVSFYPNPSTGLIYLNYSFIQDGKVTIEFKDLFGRLVYSRNIEKGNNSKTISTIVNLKEENIPSGIYFISVSNGIEIITNKLIIE
ncbi:MAG: T9SS type A sorting domain-containing protein [Bacteroidia bacterium]|nr:T9SS type A sorting domain-containing protein [Bacteroidia bacterium]